MPSLILTPKVAVKGFNDVNYPTADFTTSSTAFVEVTTFAGNGVSIPDNTSYKLSAILSSDRKPAVTVEFRKSDGVTVLGSIVKPSGAPVPAGVRYTTATLQNKTGAALTGIRAYIKTGIDSPLPVAKIHQDSFIECHAEFNNASDVLSVIYSVNKIYMIGTGEGINGMVGVADVSLDFQEYDINNVMSAFIFSANSGGLLWTWDGSKISVSV